jgi:hypothetical protein
LNFNWLTERLAVGTTPESLDDLGALASRGVTHLIDCRAELDIYDLVAASNRQRGTKFQYLWDGTEDWIPVSHQRKGVAWFQQGIDFALPVLARPGGKLYVFCHEAANRSPTLAWTILRALGSTREQCFLAVDTGRPIATPGLLECGWWRDGEAALRELRYLTDGGQDEGAREILTG